MLRNAEFSGKMRYEGVRFNIISVTRGCVGVQFPGKKRYVALEWPLIAMLSYGHSYPFPTILFLFIAPLIEALPHFFGAIQVLRNAVGGVRFPRKKRY